MQLIQLPSAAVWQIGTLDYDTCHLPGCLTKRRDAPRCRIPHFHPGCRLVLLCYAGSHRQLECCLPFRWAHEPGAVLGLAEGDPRSPISPAGFLAPTFAYRAYFLRV